MKIRLADMTWPEVAETLDKSHAIIVPVGSIEQHGYHLPLSVDFRCPEYIAEKAAEKLVSEGKIRVIVAPVIHYTDVTHFKCYPGTIGVSTDTFMKVIEDIARGLVAQGYKNIIFLNGHGPNSSTLQTAVRKVSFDLPEAGLYALDWWSLGGDTITAIRKSNLMLHAEELETSLSLVIQPENVYLEKAVKDNTTFSLSSKWVYPDFYAPQKLTWHSRARREGKSGVMGDPTVASKESGEKFLSAIIDEFAELIKEIVASEHIEQTFVPLDRPRL